MRKSGVMVFALSALLLLLPAVARSQYDAGTKLGIRIYGGGNYVTGGDLQKGLEGRHDLWDTAFNYLGISTSGDYKPFHVGLNFGGEILYQFTENIGFGVGVGYLQAKSETKLILDGGTAEDYWKPTVSAIPITASLFYTIPAGPSFNIIIHTGVGYYLAKADVHLYEVFLGTSEHDIKTTSSGIGFHGGLGFEIKLSPNFSFLIEMRGRYASFGGFEGTDDWESVFIWTSTGTTDGKLWFYNYDFGSPIGEYPFVGLDDAQPSGTGISGVHEAKVDFSGGSAVAGIIIRF